MLGLLGRQANFSVSNKFTNSCTSNFVAPVEVNLITSYKGLEEDYSKMHTVLSRPTENYITVGVSSLLYPINS